MQDQKTLRKDINQLMTLGQLTRVYAQLASIKMKEVRYGVLSSRSFMTSVYDVFETVLFSYQQQVAVLLKDKKSAGLTFLPHNGKTVAVFLSATGGLYGDVVHNTFALIKQAMKRPDIEVTIVGNQGVSLFKREFPHMPYTYFEFPENMIDEAQLVKIVVHLVQYEVIEVYYPQFQSVIRQQPTKRIMSAQPTLEKTGAPRKKYIFEPNLQEILRFFESQIFTALLDATVRESQLSKFASRIIAMDSASERIKEHIKKQEFEYLRMSHETANRKQLNQLNGMMMWMR